MRARSKFGIAIAAMIRMIGTTISNSISEKPFCFRISFSLFSVIKCGLSRPNYRVMFAFYRPDPAVTKAGRPKSCRYFVFKVHEISCHQCFLPGVGLPGLISVRFCLWVDNLCHFGTWPETFVSQTKERTLNTALREKGVREKGMQKKERSTGCRPPCSRAVYPPPGTSPNSTAPRWDKQRKLRGSPRSLHQSHLHSRRRRWDRT